MFVVCDDCVETSDTQESCFNFQLLQISKPGFGFKVCNDKGLPFCSKFCSSASIQSVRSSTSPLTLRLRARSHSNELFVPLGGSCLASPD